MNVYKNKPGQRDIVIRKAAKHCIFEKKNTKILYATKDECNDALRYIIEVLNNSKIKFSVEGSVIKFTESNRKLELFAPLGDKNE